MASLIELTTDPPAPRYVGFGAMGRAPVAFPSAISSIMWFYMCRRSRCITAYEAVYGGD